MKQQRKHKLKKVTGYSALIAVLGKATIEGKVSSLPADKKENINPRGLAKMRRKNNY